MAIVYSTGSGRRWKYDGSWLSALQLLTAGIATGATAPTAANLTDDSILFTGMNNAVYTVLHLFVRVHGGDAAGQLQLWMRPESQTSSDWYHIEDLEITKPVGQHFEIKVVPPGEYKLTAPNVPVDQTYDVYYRTSG